MAQIIGKYAAKKMLASQLNKNKKKHNAEPAGEYDPYYARIPDPRRPGKTKKVKKQIPDYLDDNDAVILAKVRSRAYKWDMALFDLFGVRFGWGSVIGLAPFIGDFIDCFVALLVVKSCMKVTGGLSNATLMLMLLNVAIDFGIGFVPILGDLADAAFKANCKNVRLLEKELDKKYKPKAVTEEEKRQREEYRRSGMHWQQPEPATVYEDFSDEEGDRADLAGARPVHGGTAGAAPMREPTRPQAARAPDERRGDAPPPYKKSWFGGKKQAPGDVEMGRNNGTAADGHGPSRQGSRRT
ncbi:hypothetical protein K402DRAFT_355357 [Aulographum hederae CBS 113979]|uniref:PH domain-containing protein n=1 Tax=Aulographum hederae CBS 113979 TaxID=1176131 RepID=A0A6G1H0P2_9PEZI|nr:hypothetical protein K402DRAFT_355357 [Aulographum hederae CBS 113979]